MDKKITPTTALTAYVAQNDLAGARQMLREAFWSGTPLTETELETVSTDASAPMRRLLATYTSATDAPMPTPKAATLRSTDQPQCIAPVRKAASLGTSPPSLPQEWVQVLNAFHEVGAKEAVIAGGALRDHFNGKSVKDVDIFMNAKAFKWQDRRRIQQAFKKAKLSIARQKYERQGPYGISTEYGLIPPHKTSSFDAQDTFKADSYHVIAGPDGTDYNIVFVNPGIHQKNNNIPVARAFAYFITELFDINICKISTSGDWVYKSEDYNNGVQEKKIKIVRANACSAEHLERVTTKYSDWEHPPAPKDENVTPSQTATARAGTASTGPC